MTKIRKDTKANITIINNIVIRDAELSWKARGIFAYLWSLPEDWDFYESEITKHATDGKDSTGTGLDELEEKGYLVRSRARNNRGQLQGSIWILHEHPQSKAKKPNPSSENPQPKPEKPIPENPVQDNAVQDNPQLLNTNLTKHESNKTLTKTNSASDDAPRMSDLEESFNKLWEDYPNKKGKKQAFNHYKAWRKKSVKNTDEYLARKLADYLAYCSNNSDWYHPMNGSTWFNGRFDDELTIDKTKDRPENGGFDKEMMASAPPDGWDDDLPF